MGSECQDKVVTRHLANAITVSRLLGVFLVFFLIPPASQVGAVWVLVLYAVLCLTDALDGWVARRLSGVSEFGKIMDPVVDKVMVLLFLPLIHLGAVAAFPIFLIFTPEFLVMAIRVGVAKRDQVIPAGFLGKVKTALTLGVIGFLIARLPLPGGGLLSGISPSIDTLLVWIVVVITLVSAVPYVREALTQNS